MFSRVLFPPLLLVLSLTASLLTSLLFSPAHFFFPSPVFILTISSWLAVFFWAAQTPRGAILQALRQPTFTTAFFMDVVLGILSTILVAVMLLVLPAPLYLAFMAYSILLGNFWGSGGIRPRHLLMDAVLLSAPLVLLAHVSFLLNSSLRMFLVGLGGTGFLAKFPLPGVLSPTSREADQVPLSQDDKARKTLETLMIAAGMVAWCRATGVHSEVAWYPFWNHVDLNLLVMAASLSPQLSFMIGPYRMPGAQKQQQQQQQQGGEDEIPAEQRVVHSLWTLARDLALVVASQPLQRTPVFPQHVAAILSIHLFNYILCKRAGQQDKGERGRDGKGLSILGGVVFILVSGFLLLGFGNSGVAHHDGDGLHALDMLTNPEKPNAVIYTFVRRNRLEEAIQTLVQLDTFFNSKYDYPVLVFHGDDLRREEQTRIRKFVWSRITFELVEFGVPPDEPRKGTEEELPCVSHPIEGSRISRFRSSLVLRHHSMESFDWGLRIDVGVNLLSEVGFDLLRFMQHNDLSYGYLATAKESLSCVSGLWEAARLFAVENNLDTGGFDNFLTEVRILNTNVEVMRLSLFRSANYLRYFAALDREANANGELWGDSMIKTAGVALFVPDSKLYQFSEIHYEHDHVAEYPLYFDWGTFSVTPR